jgi:hypothetical protein
MRDACPQIDEEELNGEVETEEEEEGGDVESCLTHLDPWEQAAIIQVSHSTEYQKLLIGNNQVTDSQFIWKH